MAGDTTVRDGDFWARVRVALGLVRPDRVGDPAHGQAAIARQLGIKPRLGSRIEDELAQGWSVAAGRRVSLSLLVIEIDRAAEFHQAYGREAMDDCMRQVMAVVAGTLPRSTDTCLRMGRSSLVLVLPDLPALMARSIAARIAAAIRTLAVPHRDSHAGSVTVSAGLAVCNPHGAYDRAFFEAAAEALKKAQRKGLGRLEAVDLRPEQERRRAAA
jgi:diguanylate cyclase (GGDEF)-like protein